MGDSKEPPDPDIIENASTETLTEELTKVASKNDPCKELSTIEVLDNDHQQLNFSNIVSDFLNTREQRD